MIPEAEKRSMDNEIGKEEFLMKDTEMSLLPLFTEWWLSPAGGTLRNCASGCVFTPKLPPIIPLVKGCPLRMLTPLYSMLHLPTDWFSNFPPTCTRGEVLAICNEVSMTFAPISRGQGCLITHRLL